MLISLTLDDKEVGAEQKQGGREIPDRESGLEVPAMEPGASGHQLLLATLLKQVGIGNDVHPCHPQSTRSSWPATFGKSALGYQFSVLETVRKDIPSCTLAEARKLGPRAKSNPLVFVNKVLLEYSHTHSYTYCIWLL